MKNKKILIIILIIIIIIVGISVLILKRTDSTNPYKNVLDRIENKETFAILISKEKDFFKKSTFKYYSEAYSIPIEHLIADDNNENYKKILELIGNYTLNEEDVVFQLVDKGRISGSLTGSFDEKYIKKLLIETGYISKKYKDIDVFISNDFDKYYKSDKTYNVLYIGEDDKNFYEYRKLLVKNKIPSLVLLLGISDINTIEYLEKEINIKDVETELPALIKIRNKKIISHYKHITLNNLVKECK